MKKKRIVEVDIFRGMAVIFMIIGHSILRYPVDITQIPFCYNLEHFIFTFHMELFFGVAGVVYKCRKYDIYLKSKVNRILIPYFLFAFLDAFLHVWGGRFINGTGTLRNEISEIFLTGGGYWFLYTIFIIYVLFPVLERYLSDVVLAVLLLIMIILSGIFNVKLFCIQLILYHLPFFGFGYLVWKNGQTALKWLKATSILKKIIFLMLSILAYIALNRLYEVSQSPIIKFFRATSVIFGILIITFLLINNCRNKYLIKVITLCSEYSLQIYLFNGYFLVIYREIICNLLNIRNPYIILCTLPILIISSILVLCKVLERTKYLSLIVGLKKKEVNNK